MHKLSLMPDFRFDITQLWTRLFLSRRHKQSVGPANYIHYNSRKETSRSRGGNGPKLKFYSRKREWAGRGGWKRDGEASN